MEGEKLENLKIADMIARGPWREAVTYRDTWPQRVRPQPQRQPE